MFLLASILASVLAAGPTRDPGAARCPVPPPSEPAAVLPTINAAPGGPFQFSPDDRLLLMGTRAYPDPTRSADGLGPVSIWHLETGRLLWTLGPETRGYRYAMFSHDSRHVVVQTHTEITAWSVADGSRAAYYPRRPGEYLRDATPDAILTTTDGDVTSVLPIDADAPAFEAWETPGRLVNAPGLPLLGIQGEDRLEVLDADTRETLLELGLTPDTAAARALAAVEKDTGRPWTQNHTWFREPIGDPVLTVLAEHGNLKADGDVRGRVRIWNESTGQELGAVWISRTFPKDPGEPGDGVPYGNLPFEATPLAVARSPWSEDFVVVRDGRAYETGWDVSGPEPVLLYDVPAGVYALAFSADGKRLYAGDRDGSIVTVDVSTGRIVERSTWGSGRLHALARSPDGRTVAAVTVRGGLWIWREGEPARHLTDAVPVQMVADAERHPAMHAIPEGKIRAIAFEDDDTVMVHWLGTEPLRWDVPSGRLLEPPRREAPIAKSVVLDGSPKGRYLRLQRPDGRIWLRDNARGSAIGMFLRRGEVQAGFEPGGALRFLLDGTGELRWAPDADAPEPVEARPGFEPMARSDAGHELWVDGDRTVFEHGEVSLELSLRDPPVLAAFGPAETGLVTVSEHGVLSSWDAAGRLRNRVEVHRAAPTALAVARDGGWVASAAEDGTVRLHDLATLVAGRKLSLPAPARTLAVSEDGRLVFAVTDEGVFRWTGRGRPTLWHPDGDVAFLGLTPGASEVLVLWNDGREVRAPAMGDASEAMQASAPLKHVRTDAAAALVAGVDAMGHVVVRDLRRPAAEEAWIRAPADVTDVSISADGCAYVAITGAGVVELRDVQNDRLWARYAMRLRPKGATWVVIDPSGRFDASDGYVYWMHYVAPTPEGPETLGLEQMRSYYLQPGLNPWLFEERDDAVPIAQFDPFRDLHPHVEWTLEERAGRPPLLHVELRERGGGLGRVAILLDGREIVSDAIPSGADRGAGSLSFDFDLSGVKGFAPRAGEPNLLSVVAYSRSEQLASRGQTRAVRAPDGGPSAEPHLWVVAIGTNDYADSRMKLKYAVKDATVFANTLELGARPLFDDRVHTVVLENPDRQAILDAFDGIYARPDDVVVTYFAGHGVTEQGSWLYPTTEARTDDWKRPGLREARTYSDLDLIDALTGLPASRRAVILDTCGAGAFTADLVERSVEDLRQRKLVSQLEQRTGTYVLAGSAASAASKEDPRRGHGLLTWSLLSAMQTRDEWNVDELFAQTLETLDEISSGDQKGFKTASNTARSFPIGQSTPEVVAALDLRGPAAVVVRSQMWPEGGGFDRLNLQQAVDQAIEYEADALDFVDDYTAKKGYRVAGAYRTDGAALTAAVEVFGLEDGEPVAAFTVDGDTSDPQGVARCIALSAQSWIQHRVTRGGTPPPERVRAGSCGPAR